MVVYCSRLSVPSEKRWTNNSKLIISYKKMKYLLPFKQGTKTIGLFTVLSLLAVSNTYAAKEIDGYKQVKKPGGTSQSICRPAISTAEDLKAFANNQRNDLLSILADANWQGDTEAVLTTIDNGDFDEKSYPVGTKLKWMGMRDKTGIPIAAEKRQWTGDKPFEGFELNVTSTCAEHQLVIPKACCNLSLVKSSPIKVPSPVVSVDKEGDNAMITVRRLHQGFAQPFLQFLSQNVLFYHYHCLRKCGYWS